MLPAFTTSSVRSSEKQLCAILRGLSAEDQATLLKFAEFLVASQAEKQAPMTVFPEPEAILRPEEESVVKGIKRLTATYPMINKDKLLHQTSDLMAEHVIKGRAASEVIDDLEVMFAEHYQQLKNEFEQNC
ncbi:MAG: hypothetical protein ACPGSM_13955 [Thiolinea sp.]